MSKARHTPLLTRTYQVDGDLLNAWINGTFDEKSPSLARLMQAIRTILESFYSRRMTSDRADVEDLVQEALIAIYQHRYSYDQTRPFHGWLFGIARHKLIDYFRNQRKHIHFDLVENTLAAGGPDLGIAEKLDVERLLSALPAKQANVIRDTQIIGLTAAECARHWRIGESDVRVSVHRGLKAMRRSTCWSFPCRC
jgi:RNA polymerase sigma factor (sigma-70 family)